MKIGIIGKAGSGKSTLSEILRRSGERVFDIDNFVKDLYANNEDVQKKLVQLKLLNEGMTVFKNKQYYINNLIAYPFLKRDLEDYLWEDHIFPIISNIDGNLYVDGILPRYSIYMDQVIFVETSNELRKHHLSKRYKEESYDDIQNRIGYLEKLQEDFPTLFKN